jgi:hypothetical protein
MPPFTTSTFEPPHSAGRCCIDALFALAHAAFSFAFSFLLFLRARV